jgi:phage terminase large subunit
VEVNLRTLGFGSWEPEMILHEKQELAFWALTQDDDVREVLFGGAKNGGKSYLGVAWIFGSAVTYTDTRWFIARKELNDLRKHTTPTIMEWFKNTGLNFDTYCTFNGQDNFYTLYNGSKVFLIDCKHIPSDDMYERFGSLQFTGGWIEEGGEIPVAAYENLKLSIGRWNNDAHNLQFKLLITCNPKKNWMYTEFYLPAKKKVLPKEKVFIQALVTDNAFRQSGSIEVLDQIKDKITKARLRFGDWEYVNDPSCLMDYDSIISIFTNTHVQPVGNKYITVDVARFGNDATTIRAWHGLRVIEKVKLLKASTKTTADKIKLLQVKHQVAPSNTIIDEDGIGGGVVDQCPGSKGFLAQSAPINPKPGESYKNLKSQCAYKLAEIVNGKGIYEEESDPTEQELLIGDLEQIKEADVDSDGKRSIVSKDEIKKLIGRSPDDGDNLLMRMYFELKATGPSFVSGLSQKPSNGRTINSM